MANYVCMCTPAKPIQWTHIIACGGLHWVTGSVEFCTTAGLSYAAKFTKLLSVKDRVFLSDAKSLPSDFPAHSLGQRQFFRHVSRSFTEQMDSNFLRLNVESTFYVGLTMIKSNFLIFTYWWFGRTAWINSNQFDRYSFNKLAVIKCQR